MVKVRRRGSPVSAWGWAVRVILLTVLLLSAAAVALPRAAHADVMVQEGTAFSGTVVATPNCAAISPTIDWGDGTPTSAGTTVAGPQGPATVHGTHTYAEAGTYTGTVTYTCAQFAGQQQVQFTATVSDAPLTPTGLNFSGTVTSELAPTTAHVDDANPDSVSSDFTATIDWGDGSSSAGTVSASGGGGYDIAGSHTYDEPGTYMVTTSVTDPGGGTSAASTATIGGPHTPDTSIDSGPSGTINTAGPTFAFSSDTLGATFQCSLDGAAYTTCATPLTLGPLSDGPHTFAVRALASGRTDPTPATRMFSVDTGPPDTTIDSGPTGVTTARTPQFTFSSNRADSTYECSVDGATFVACTSPLTTAALADGPHQLAVRAVEGGQTDPTPATRAFSVDTTAPDTTIVSGPDDGAALDPAAAAPVYGFTSSEPGSSFLCRTYLVGSAPGAFTPCATPAAATPTGQGTWQFEVAAVDPAGNADPTPASRTFANIAPDTTITEGPSGTTWTVRPLFGFASTIDGSTFQCRVDGSSWADCATPLLLPTLTAGPHEFAVRAISPQHITDPTPAVRDFSVAAAYTAPQQQCRVLIPQYTFDNATGATPYHQALCTLPLGTCPVGARCTMHASSTVTEAGNQGTFPYMTGEIFMAPTGGYGGCGNAHYLGPQASGAVPYRFGPGGCSFALDSGFPGRVPAHPGARRATPEPERLDRLRRRHGYLRRRLRRPPGGPVHALPGSADRRSVHPGHPLPAQPRRPVVRPWPRSGRDHRRARKRLNPRRHRGESPPDDRPPNRSGIQRSGDLGAAHPAPPRTPAAGPPGEPHRARPGGLHAGRRWPRDGEDEAGDAHGAAPADPLLGQGLSQPEAGPPPVGDAQAEPSPFDGAATSPSENRPVSSRWSYMSRWASSGSRAMIASRMRRWAASERSGCPGRASDASAIWLAPSVMIDRRRSRTSLCEASRTER